MENQLFQFTCLPNGLSNAPRICTKLMKPVYSTLRCKGFENVEYIDTFLEGRTFHESNYSVLFRNLGLNLNIAKSVLIETYSVYYLFGVCIKLKGDDCLINTNKSYKNSIESS